MNASTILASRFRPVTVSQSPRTVLRTFWGVAQISSCARRLCGVLVTLGYLRLSLSTPVLSGANSIILPKEEGSLDSAERVALLEFRPEFEMFAQAGL